jgi:O-antigen ligase
MGPLFLTLPITGILLFSLISTLFSIDGSLSLYHLIRMLLLFGFYLFLLNEIDDLKLVLFPVGAQIFIQSVTAVLQVLGQQSIGLSFLGELDLDPSWSGVSIVWAEGIRSLRAYGLTDHPNILGGCLSFGLILIAYGYLTTAAWRRTLLTALFSLGVLGLFYTFSRAAWLSAALGLTLLGVWQLRKGRIRQLASYLGLVAASLIALAPFFLHNLPYVGVRLNQQGSFAQNAHEKQAIGERIILNRNANNIFLAEPFTGVGLGAFPIALQAHRPDYPYNFQPAHIVLLDVAAETGFFGALFYLLSLGGNLAEPGSTDIQRRSHCCFEPAAGHDGRRLLRLLHLASKCGTPLAVAGLGSMGSHLLKLSSTGEPCLTCFLFQLVSSTSLW